MRRVAGAALCAVAACVPDATRPRTGVPTLDDFGSDGFVAVSSGRAHSCGLMADGVAWCWGSNEFGQLGIALDGQTCARSDRAIPCRTVPVRVNGTLRFRRIAAGGVHTCGLATDDRIYCWGDNLRGALGDPSLRWSPTPVPIVTTALFSDVAAGMQHSCGVRLDGVGVCWGANDWGQAGTGNSAASIGSPAAISAQFRFASITASGDRTCGVALDAIGYCWGRLYAGVFAGGDGRAQYTPARVQGTLLFRSIEAGVHTTCGVTLDNAPYCWEANTTGTIGDGTLAGNLLPQPVAGGRTFIVIRSGVFQTCGIAENGRAYCWGAGGLGELGTSPLFLPSRCGASRVPCAVTPMPVSGWRQYSWISTGQGAHTCALSYAGNVYCWGAGDMGQRGDGRTSTAEWSPVKVSMPHSVTAIVTDNTAVLPQNH